jgi:hypothetical protein
MQSKYLQSKNNFYLFIFFCFIGLIGFDNFCKAQSGKNLNPGYEKERITADSLRAIAILDVEDESHPLVNDSSYIIILKNNRSCLSCFSILSQDISSLCNNSLRIFSLSCIDSSFLERKRIYKQNCRIMPEVSRHYFYISSSSNFLEKRDAWKLQENLFDELGIQTTPALILIKRNSMKLVDYSKIFNFSYTGISEETREEVINFFKEP